MKVDDRVNVFIASYFQNDQLTPLSLTTQAGTIVSMKANNDHKEPSWMKCDILLDTGRTSRGHFLWALTPAHPQSVAEGAD